MCMNTQPQTVLYMGCRDSQCWQCDWFFSPCTVVVENFSIRMCDIYGCILIWIFPLFCRCGMQSTREENFINLSLDLVPGGTVRQCLQGYFKVMPHLLISSEFSVISTPSNTHPHAPQNVNLCEYCMLVSGILISSMKRWKLKPASYPFPARRTSWSIGASVVLRRRRSRGHFWRCQSQ